MTCASEEDEVWMECEEEYDCTEFEGRAARGQMVKHAFT